MATATTACCFAARATVGREVLATALNYSARRRVELQRHAALQGQTNGTRVREETEHEPNVAPRGQKTPSPGVVFPSLLVLRLEQVTTPLMPRHWYQVRRLFHANAHFGDSCGHHQRADQACSVTTWVRSSRIIRTRATCFVLVMAWSRAS